MIEREMVREWKLEKARQATGVGGLSTVGATYRAALKQMGLDASDLPAEAARAVFDAVKGRRARQHAMATDAKAASARTERFPNANRLHRDVC